MCQVHYLWEAERDSSFGIVLLSRAETLWHFYQDRPHFDASGVFWLNKAGTGNNDLFVMQIPPSFHLSKHLNRWGGVFLLFGGGFKSMFLGNWAPSILSAGERDLRTRSSKGRALHRPSSSSSSSAPRRHRSPRRSALGLWRDFGGPPQVRNQQCGPASSPGNCRSRILPLTVCTDPRLLPSFSSWGLMSKVIISQQGYWLACYWQHNGWIIVN